MLLPESLIWAIGSDGCSAVKIFCDDDIKEEVADCFTEFFNEEYENVMDLIEEDDGDCYEKDEDLNPFLGAQITDYGGFLPFDSLAMYCSGGDVIAQHDAGEALNNSLARIKEEYPSIRYEGFVGYYWSDIHSGEVCQYELSSEKKKSAEPIVYDFVGRFLGMALEDDDAWEEISDHLQFEDIKEYKKIWDAFQLYSEWVPSDAKDKLLELAEEQDEEIRESLEKYMG